MKLPALCHGHHRYGNAFVTGKAFTLNVDLAVQGKCIKAKASPQPRSHAVWQSLDHATRCLPGTE
ncbi:MAG: hypothetical protein MJE77_44620 [Proteobacteria bacterium]|nr:hypothetical protein [Pseudomonadota bacterium]